MQRLMGMMLLLTAVLMGCGEADAPPATALKQLGAGIQRNAQGEIDGVSLCDTQVTDAGLVHLAGLTNLRVLTLLGDQITDADLVHLKGLTKLEDLSLGGPQVTDAGWSI